MFGVKLFVEENLMLVIVLDFLSFFFNVMFLLIRGGNFVIRFFLFIGIFY